MECDLHFHIQLPPQQLGSFIFSLLCFKRTWPGAKMENESYELKCGTENKYGPTSAADGMTPCWFFSPEQARFIFTRL